MLFSLILSALCSAHEFAPIDAVNRVLIEVRGDFRYVNSNGIANHETGTFPNANNPGTIAEQKYEFKMPAHPAVAANTVRVERGWIFGVAINGVPFDPGTAEFWNNDPAWNIEAMTGHINLGLDKSNAHVQPGGVYHYHAMPTGLIDKISFDKNNLACVGFAADGFRIYSQFGYKDRNDAKSGVRKMKSSYHLKEGTRPDGPGGKYDGTYSSDFQYIKESGDLDECNGRFGVTPENPEGAYHYYITEDFPFIPRLYRGTPDLSFHKGPPRGRGPGRGPGGRPPPPPPPGFGFPFPPPPPPR